MIRIGIITLAVCGSALPVQAELTCDDVRTNLEANVVQPLPADDTTCAAGREVGSKITLAGTSICYMTGLPELPPPTGKRTITMRRGSEIVTIEVDPATPDIDEDPTIDTVEMVISAKMCQGGSGIRLLDGNWRITGRDGGETFSAKGFFPSDTVWVHALEFPRDKQRTISLGFELPVVTLELDAAPRSIAGVAVFPVFNPDETANYSTETERWGDEW